MIREKTIFRNFLFGAVLLAGGVLAVSCSVDETDSISDMNSITFSTEFTRATATTINNLDEFTVWGWKVDAEGAVTGTLMNGATAVNSGNGTYNTTKTYYWPGCAVDFLAVSPLATTVDDTNDAVYIGEQVYMTEIGENGVETYEGYFAEGAVNAESGRIETLSIHVPEAADEQADLLYAYTPDRSTGKVPLNFRHALAQVEFQALNTNSWMTVEIAGVKVASVANHGELVLPTEATSATDGAYGTWTPAAVYSGTEYAAGISGTVTLGSTATALTADGGSLFLIPQETWAWVNTDVTNTEAGAYFLISCRITELGVELWPGDGTFAEVAVPFAPDWEQGKKYTYTFTFGEGAGYYPPSDTDTNAGTPILNGPIDFTVEVGDLDSDHVIDDPEDADNYIVVKTYEELDAAVEGDWHYIIVEGNIDIGEANGHGLGIYADTVIIIEDGYTITAPNSGGNAPYAAFYLDYIADGRGYPNLTIDGDGTIATTGDSAAANTYCIYVREGDLTINSGTFKGGVWNVENYTGTDYCIYGYGYAGDVNVTINGGSFQTGSHTNDLYAYPNSSYNINFTVNAGKFYMYDPSGYVSSGSTMEQDGDWYVVKH